MFNDRKQVQYNESAEERKIHINDGIYMYNSFKISMWYFIAYDGFAIWNYTLTILEIYIIL